MSGAQTSTFGDPNILLNTLSGMQTTNVLHNQLLNQYDQAGLPYRVQSAQQQVGEAEIEYLARASYGLLNNYTDEASRAAAYPGVVAALQQQGLAKNAPAEYPGEARLRQIAALGTPSSELYKLGQAGLAIPTPGFAGGGAGGAAPGGSSSSAMFAIPQRGPGGPGGSANMPPEYLPYVMEASRETGLPPDLIIAQMRQESNFDANAKGKAGEIGL